MMSVLSLLLLLLAATIVLYTLYRHYLYHPKNSRSAHKHKEENFTFKL